MDLLAGINLNEMSEDELHSMRSALEEDMRQIRAQLEMAAARYNETGQASNSTWVVRARSALRAKGAQSQRVQVELGRRRRTRGKEYATHFIDAAREILPEGVYSMIQNEARKRSGL